MPCVETGVMPGSMISAVRTPAPNTFCTAFSNRSASAPYIIYHSTGTATVRVNQQVNGGKWNYLGTWAMSTGKVQLSCWTTTGYVVVADAIKWVKQ